ncbi:MAG TPA: pitrilysin family protein [Steroidobacteraceae bacterium]|nr:pitrilysin family protein [Steroidobacteraceae bacterium]
MRRAGHAAAAAPALPEVPFRRGPAIPPYERVVLDNGFTLAVMPSPGVPLVAFHAVLRGGALCDRPGLAGTASLAAGLLDKGAGARDGFAFADAVEGAGGSFNAAATADSIAITGQFLARDQALMLELLADALLSPHFAAAELDRLRARQIGHIRAAKDFEPEQLLPLYGRALLFGAHPYGRPVCGSELSLEQIRIEDVRGFWRAHAGADRAALVVAGDVDVAWLKAAVRQRFGGWRRAPEPLPRTAPPARPRRRVLLVDAPGCAQTHFWLGGPGVGRDYPRRAALDLVNTLYGGRFTSMLNTELRIRSGLTYGASSGFTRGLAGGEFSIRSSTLVRHTVKALDLALRSLTHLKRTGVTGAMLDSARAYLIGQYPLLLETAADWALQLAELELYGLPPGHVEGYVPALRAAKVADAQQVITAAFPPRRDLVIVLIADAARVRGRLARYGPLAQMRLADGRFTPEG